MVKKHQVLILPNFFEKLQKNRDLAVDYLAVWGR
jgi:hypothetical protein